MKVRQLIERIPFIAECVDADRFSARNIMIYDYEIANPNGVFGFRISDNENDRLSVLEIPSDLIGNKDTYRYAMDRLRACMLSFDKKQGRIGKSGEDELQRLVVAEKNTVEVPEVDDILSMGDVVVMDVW